MEPGRVCVRAAREANEPCLLMAGDTLALLPTVVAPPAAAPVAPTDGLSPNRRKVAGCTGTGELMGEFDADFAPVAAPETAAAELTGEGVGPGPGVVRVDAAAELDAEAS